MSRLDEALSILDLEDWLSSYENILPGAGPSEFRLENCPSCGNSKFKLYVNTDKRIWNCFRCGYGRQQGDICALMAAVSGRHINSIKLELAQTVVPTPEDPGGILARLDPEEEEREVPVIEGVEAPGSPGFTGITGKRAHKYALSRGLSEKMIEDLQLRPAMKIPGKKKNKVIKGPFLMFPVYYYGIIVAWQGRRLISKGPKYISSDNIHQWLYPIDEKYISVIADRKEVYLAEGVFDALALWKAGVPAVCTFGKGLKARQAKLLKQHKVERVFIAYDTDAQREVRKVAKDVSKSFKDVYVVAFSENGDTDPGDYLKDDRLEDWIKEGLDRPIKLEVSSKKDTLEDWHIKRLLDG